MFLLPANLTTIAFAVLPSRAQVMSHAEHIDWSRLRAQADSAGSTQGT